MIRAFIISLLNFCVISLVMCQNVSGQYSGLMFKGHKYPLDQRTGLILTPTRPISIHDRFELSFEIKFEPKQSYFGYIMRTVLDGENYDFVYTPQSNNNYNNFHLIIGEKISNISFYYPVELVVKQWKTVRLNFDGPQNNVQLFFNDSVYATDLKQVLGRSKLFLFFGAHRFENYISTDVPGMNLREVKIRRNGKLLHHWPLNQVEGEKVYNVVSSRNGSVNNPVWILSRHATWNLAAKLSFKGRISYIYDATINAIVIMTADSILKYSLDSDRILDWRPNIYRDPLTDFHLIADPVSSELFAYSIDQNVKIKLDSAQKYKLGNKHFEELTDHWHHNRIMNPENQVLFTFGGYGNFHYSNKILRFNDLREKWDTLEYQGTFQPRYLAGVGYNQHDKKAYIIGGYGSPSGQQAINPCYYHELIAYSFKENEFTTLVEFGNQAGEFCYSNTLHIDTSTNLLYGLKFSKFETKPSLQLVSVSLDNFRIKPLGEAFDFTFLDVNSTVNLYYNPGNQELVSVTSYYDNKNTEIKINKISYPPINNSVTNTRDLIKRRLVILTSIIVIIMIVVFIFINSRNNKKAIHFYQQTKDHKLLYSEHFDLKSIGIKQIKPEIQKRPSSILIFGGFQVIDKTGANITGSFTPLLKELFLCIMLNSIRYDKGVSTSKLNEFFWFDKTERAARNNRGVNIAKLKERLERIGECRLSKQSGYWEFRVDLKKVYIDYAEFIKLVREKDNWSKQDVLTVLKIVQNGAALPNIHAEWLDDFKAEISDEIIDGLHLYIRRNHDKKDLEFNILLTNCIFHFDLANEEAMLIKCKNLVALGKHGLAKNSYVRFVKEYEILYGEKYPASFTDVISDTQ